MFKNKKITEDTKKTISVYVNAENTTQVGCYVELDKMTILAIKKNKQKIPLNTLING